MTRGAKSEGVEDTREQYQFFVSDLAEKFTNFGNVDSSTEKSGRQRRLILRSTDMTKDVLVSISGAHIVDGDSDDVSVITARSYFCKNGKHYVIYDELIDGVEGAIRSTIKIREDIVEIIKSGSARSHMIFEKEKQMSAVTPCPSGRLLWLG